MACSCGNSASGSCMCRIEGTGPISVSGAGSEAGPYEIGFEISGLPDNIAELDSNGDLYVPASGTEVPGFVDGNGLLLLPDESNNIRVPQYPCVLDYNGDPIEPDGNNCVQLPPSGAVPSLSCGIEVDETGLTVATTNTWPLSPLAGPAYTGADTTGGPTYCDSNGEIRTAPEHTAVSATLASTTLFNTTSIIADGASYTSPSSGAVLITNPSPTRNMVVLGSFTLTFSGSSGSTPMTCRVERDIGSGFSSWNPYNLIMPYDGSTATITELAVTAQYSVSLAPGASHSINLRVLFDNTAATGPATRRSAAVKGELLGVTQ